jgi:hypothetical protein
MRWADPVIQEWVERWAMMAKVLPTTAVCLAVTRLHLRHRTPPLLRGRDTERRIRQSAPHR